MSHLTAFCTGRLKRRTLLRVFLPLILASYFGSLGGAISMLPGPFDWRTRAMSKLLYPKNDPKFHALVSAGVAIAGLLMIPFAGYIGRRLRPIAPATAMAGALVFGAGAISLILAALIAWQGFLHELFARSAGLCFGIGLLAFYLGALRGISARQNDRQAWLRLFRIWSLIAPAALLVVILRLLAAAHFQSPNPIYREIENRSLWHLGFWEWSGSAAVFLFLLAATLFLPKTVTSEIAVESRFDPL
ncbi:MAG: hypothetical protein ABSG46_12900 [Candidatus Binataceae bacterium]|jgi:hypothetical protein